MYLSHGLQLSNSNRMKENMHYGATADIFQTAAILRRDMTSAEIELWEKLKANQLDGLKFRRQHPISRYIVDFYCHKHKLVIELDGGIHLKKEVAKHDMEREIELKKLGLTVIRFKNEDIFNKMDTVLEKIRTIIKEVR